MDNKNDDSAGSDSLDKSLQLKCVVDDVGQGEGTLQSDPTDTSTDAEDEKPCFTLHNEQTETCDGDISGDTTSSSSLGAGSGSTTFETTVTQIAQDLEETTLAETDSHTTLSSDDAVAATSNSSSSSSSSSTTSLESAPESAPPSVSSQADSVNQSADQDSSVLSANESSIDDQDQRSKNVRFHPDVKENDGGNRVIPKKKKKLKGSDDDGEGGSSQGAGSSDDEMELDDEEDLSDEDDFDLARTIAEAQDYLKVHPLTFARPRGKNASVHNGLLDEEPPTADGAGDEDHYERVPPENGIERILGKQMRCGKVEFLLRFADHADLFWESEDFVWKNCPTLLTSYEQNRERRQERLMLHVASRQNLRQRYTDF